MLFAAQDELQIIREQKTTCSLSLCLIYWWSRKVVIMKTAIDLTGERFGRLVVLERVENSKHNAAQWLCQCDCGKRIIANSNNLRTLHTSSCGCKRAETTSRFLKKYNTKHGGCNERLYAVWQGIISRVTRPGNKRYTDYGGRGIKICDEWKDYSVFRDWAYSNGYNENALYGKCTIDRIDVNGNYEPSNCRWVDLKTQANNKRGTDYGSKIFAV
jgi:hypothetical protein